MSPAGYSGTPLPKKLGIKADHRVALIGAPEDFEQTLGTLPDRVTVQRSLRGTRLFDVVLFFTKREQELTRRLARLKARLTTAGGLWIAWPKKASKVATDVDESVVRRLGLGTGLVDNKICAVDEVWSGLRFVRRLEDRDQE